MDDMERRAFMKGAAIGALAFTVGGAEVMLTPRQAHADKVPLRTLTADQAATLGAVGETLVPGAREAGIVNFVDQQISGPRRTKRCCRRASSMCGRLTPISIARALGAIDAHERQGQGPQVRESLRPTSSTTSSI